MNDTCSASKAEAVLLGGHGQVLQQRSHIRAEGQWRGHVCHGIATPNAHLRPTFHMNMAGQKNHEVSTLTVDADARVPGLQLVTVYVLPFYCFTFATNPT